MQEEVEEVEAKLEASEQQAQTQWQRMLARLCTPVFLEALVLTFLAGTCLLRHRQYSRLVQPQHSNPASSCASVQTPLHPLFS